MGSTESLAHTGFDALQIKPRCSQKPRRTRACDDVGRFSSHHREGTQGSDQGLVAVAGCGGLTAPSISGRRRQPMAAPPIREILADKVVAGSAGRYRLSSALNLPSSYPT